MENDRTRERVKKKNQYLIVIDASNILHHGGNGLNVDNLLSFLMFLFSFFQCKEEEVLVILDFWVADKLGEETLKQIRSAHQYTRVTRKGVTADVRIIQTAYAVQACIVSNDMYYKCVIRRHAGDYNCLHLQVSRLLSISSEINSTRIKAC